MEVPRYGIHNGIKYSPRRTLVRWCTICSIPFHPIGRRDKVCSEECRYINNKNVKGNYNFENNPKYISIYQPPRNEQERRARSNYWKVWYANLSPEQRQRYNAKKKKNVKRSEDTYQSIQDEMKALGLR